jgi:hypothetical protein
MRRGAVVLVSLAAAWLTGPAAAKPTSDCLLGMRGSLVRGGFSGPLICSRRDATFVLVGQTSKSHYSVYDYRYRFLPRNGNVMHGGQKIVVFQGARYIGQYPLSPPPYASVAVYGGRVVVKSRDGKDRYSLDFSNGPQKKVFVDGEILTFYR